MSVATPSIQSQVMAHVVATLRTTGLHAFRSKMSAFGTKQLPAYNVLPDAGDTEYIDSDSVDRRFRFKVHCTQVAVDEVDAAVDAQYVRASQVLLADPTLGGLVMAIHEVSQKWELEKGELDSVALVVTYETEFSTSRTDPSVSW